MKFLLIMIGIIIIFHDFGLGESLGKEKRESLRKKIGDYWVWAEDEKWHGLAAKDAKIVLLLFNKIFGNRIISFRFIILSTFFSLLAFLCVYFLLIWIVEAQFFLENTAPILFIFLVPNALLDFLSLVVTFYLLLLMTRSAHLLIIILCILADICAVYVLSSLSYGVGVSVFMGQFDYLRLSVGTVELKGPPTFGTLTEYLTSGATNIEWSDIEKITSDIFRSLINFHLTIIKNVKKFLDLYGGGYYKHLVLTSELVLIVIFTTAIPTILHLMLLLCFFFSKLAPKLIQRFIGRIALGFYESKISPYKIAGAVLIFVGVKWP